MDCLPTPLKESPPGRWHCPLCPLLAPNDVFYDPPTEQIQGEPQLSEEPHVGSSSPGYPGKGMHDSFPIEDEEPNVEVIETPVPVRTRGRPRKIKVAKDVESERIPSPARPSKRMRLRVSSPVALPRIRLRLPARKGKDRDDDDEHRKGIFDDILSVDERDVSKSSVEHADKQRFERSRLAAEVGNKPAERHGSILIGGRLVVEVGTTLAATTTTTTTTTTTNNFINRREQRNINPRFF
jgi:hypothetical protein